MAHKRPGRSLRILILEDVAADAELVERELRSAGIQFASARVDSRDSFLEALDRFSPEIILSDYQLPAFDGGAALLLAGERAPEVPFIFVTGALGEERAVDLLKSGATDFVLKERLTRLPLCIERALEEVEEKRRRRQAEERLRRAHAELEGVVEERTRELRRSMEALRASEEKVRRHAEELEELNKTLEVRVAERTILAESQARQLQALAVQLIEAEERERRRIAGLLHDDLQQILASARLQLQAARQALPPDPLLSGVEELLEESIHKSRRLSHELSPSILHHAGLTAALQWLARQMKEQYGLEVELEAGEVELGGREERPLKALLFRSVQELLFNTVKHAQARSARIRLESGGGQLTVTVADSGRGFDPGILKPSAGKPVGFGLLSIRERIRAVGGRLLIESAPGAGSRFMLVVPQERPGSEADAPPAQRPPGRRRSPAPCDLKAPVPGSACRVLLVDDHKVMRQGLMAMIAGKPDIQVVGEASNGREAIELARDLSPDVIVMDVSMPEMDGIEATRRIKEEMPQVRIIGLSMFEGVDIAESMRRAGAEVFVSKSASTGSLLRAIYGLAGGGPE